MAIDFSTATDTEIKTELLKYTPHRELLTYNVMLEEIRELGQENFNGDKRSYLARIDYIQQGIKNAEAKIQALNNKNKCPISSCDVQFI